MSFAININNKWIQVAKGITRKDSNDPYNLSLSLSEDGKTIAIGDKYTAINGNESGQVEVYNIEKELLVIGPSGTSGTTSTKSIVENNKTVHTFSATETATWSLNGGADASKFNIDSSTGALTFKSAPDF